MELRKFMFPEYYSHTRKIMWKILNPYTNLSSETFVLCAVDEGIHVALDLAILTISKAKNKYYS